MLRSDHPYNVNMTMRSLRVTTAILDHPHNANMKHGAFFCEQLEHFPGSSENRLNGRRGGDPDCAELSHFRWSGLAAVDDNSGGGSNSQDFVGGVPPVQSQVSPPSFFLSF